MPNSPSAHNAPSALVLRLLDARVRIHADDPAFLRAVGACFEQPFPRPTDASRPDLDIRVSTASSGDRHERDLTTQPAGALRTHTLAGLAAATQLAAELNWWVVRRTSRYDCFHAGAVARDRHAILLPGDPFSGKSTLTAGLILRGFALLSDEIGAVEVTSGQVAGYPRALSIRPDVLARLGLESPGEEPAPGESRVVSVESLGGSRAAGSCDAALVVFPEFADKGDEGPTRLSPAEATLAFMAAYCSPPETKAAGIDRVIDMATRLPCYRLRFTDLSRALNAIESLFAEHAGSRS